MDIARFYQSLILDILHIDMNFCTTAYDLYDPFISSVYHVYLTEVYVCMSLC